jgi:hypothetical protein
LKNINSNIDSTTLCNGDGTILALAQAKLYKLKARRQASIASKDEFVKEKSIPKIEIGIILIIENCSSGEKNICEKQRI